MNEEQIIAYIAAARAKGANEEIVAKILKEQGWSNKEIYAGFEKHYEQSVGLSAPTRDKSVGGGARDAFVYLLSFATLATWIFALGSLLFTYIEQWFPDMINTYNSYRSYSVSTQMACIIVALPIYLATMWVINREVARIPEKAESGVRRWLTYLAMFLAAGTAIGDGITFLTYLLNGDLTVRFVMKVVVVLVLAGGVLAYYLVGFRTHKKTT